jgi:hypothetical protein
MQRVQFPCDVSRQRGFKPHKTSVAGKTGLQTLPANA